VALRSSFTLVEQAPGVEGGFATGRRADDAVPTGWAKRCDEYDLADDFQPRHVGEARFPCDWPVPGTNLEVRVVDGRGERAQSHLAADEWRERDLFDCEDFGRTGPPHHDCARVRCHGDQPLSPGGRGQSAAAAMHRRTVR
jgi:hypothetical protein